MQIKYPRELTKKSYIRFLNQALKNNRDFKCAKCGREFKIGDQIFKFRGKSVYYCSDCYRKLYLDISDDILDDRDKQYIETGIYPD